MVLEVGDEREQLDLVARISNIGYMKSIPSINRCIEFQAVEVGFGSCCAGTVKSNRVLYLTVSFLFGR